MKRVVLAVGVLGLVAVGVIVGLQTAGRERSYRGLLARGDVALTSGDTFGAIEAFSGAVALRPDSMLAHLRRGETYRRRGELDAATRDLRAAVQLDPAAPLPLELLADVYAARQRFDRAVDTYEQRLRVESRVPRVHYKLALALALYRLGHIDRAIASLAESIALDARLADAHYLLGLCHRDQQHTQEAVEAFERAVTLAPGLIPAREELAALYESVGRYPNQLEQLQVLAALDSTHVERQIAVGVAHARAGHPEAAAVTFANAIERSPDNPRVYQELGRMWLDVGITYSDADAIQKAIEALDHLGAGPSASSEGLSLYGRALARNGELDAARRILEQATRRFPVAPTALAAFADVAEQQHEPEAARAALLDYHALVGEDSDAATRAGRLGLLSLAANDVASAQRWLQRALASEPANPRWLKGLAQADAQAGDVSVAKASLGKALDVAPNDEDLLARAASQSRPLSTRSRASPEAVSIDELAQAVTRRGESEDDERNREA
ncbi:MAG: tetratricopeptide repeat protein [Acidimicrobiia bacterium]|nr:tetratricopeptide repeat protein [Acidimicrobiia bacterium]